MNAITAAWNRMSRWDTDNVAMAVGLLGCVVVWGCVS